MIEGKLIPITTLPCTHTHHTLCINSLQKDSFCPFPNCKEDIGMFIVDCHRTKNDEKANTISSDDESVKSNNNSESISLKVKVFMDQLSSKGPT